MSGNSESRNGNEGRRFHKLIQIHALSEVQIFLDSEILNAGRGCCSAWVRRSHLHIFHYFILLMKKKREKNEEKKKNNSANNYDGE